MNLGDGTGAELARYARERGYKNPIVICSGADIGQAMDDTIGLGVIIIPKPFNIKNVLSALKGEYNPE
ncbi:MAG: hypothetical protein KAK00_06910 [Nanoarchaeota archaeon]|nr:hypothetical protein [Nanoarchaeota archaeon]